MVHHLSLQGEFKVFRSCIVGMNEMDEFKFKPKLISYLLSSKLEIH